MSKSSNSSSKSSTKNIMGNTNTSNPFFQTTTNKDGTVKTNFVDGTLGQSVYNQGNANYDWLMDSYLRPNLDNPTAQAKLSQFNKTMGETARNTLQNNILNPLLSNNMVRSSQATNMYNNMQNQMNDSIADYTNNLIANSQNDYGAMLDRLVNQYQQAYQGIAANQSTGINAALGTNTTSTNSNSHAK